MPPAGPSSRDGTRPAWGRRLLLGGGASLLAFPWLGSQAAAQAPAHQPASLEAALSSHFGSLPQDRRYRSQVARLAWGPRDYDLGWRSPTGRATSHRAAMLAESVEGTPFDLHLVLPAGQPGSANAPPLPPPNGAVAVYDGPPQTRLPRGLSVSLQKRGDGPARAELPRGIGISLIFAVSNACRVVWGDALRIPVLEFNRQLNFQYDVCERDRKPTGLLFAGAAPGNHVEVQLDLRRGHYLADIVRGG